MTRRAAACALLLGASLTSSGSVARAQGEPEAAPPPEDASPIEVDAAPIEVEAGPPSPGASAEEGGGAPADGSDPAAGDPLEDDVSASPRSRRPIEVRVVGERADDIQKVPGSVTLITGPEMRKAQPQNVAELLRRVPGVVVRQEEGAGLRLDIGVRGLDPGRGRRVLVLEDGIPVAINPYAEADLYYQPPVERMHGIEVVKGSGSILYGPQTIGGVINFITLPAPSEQSATLDVSAGQRGYVKMLGSYGDSYESARYMVQTFFKRGDGVRDQGFEAFDLFGKVTFETWKRGEATVKIGFHDIRADSDDVGLTREMYAEDPRRPTLSPESRTKLRRYDLSLLHEHVFSDAVKLRTLVYGYKTDRIWRRQAYTRVPSPDGVYTEIVGDVDLPFGAIYFEPANRVLDRSYEVAGVEPRFQIRFPTGSIGHTVDVGGRLLGESAHIEQRIGEFPTSWAGALEIDEGRRTLALAAYIQDRIAFLDELLVTPGIRVEHARFHRNQDRVPRAGGPVDVNEDSSSDVTGVIPGIGIAAGVRDAHAFAGAHSGFAPPRVANASALTGAQADLDAERSISYEIGGRFRPAKFQRMEVTGFLTNFSNQVISQTQPGAPTELVNGGRTRHMGVEAASQTQIGQALELPLEIDVLARYGFLRATFVDGATDGNALPYAPQNTFTGVLDVGHSIGLSGQLAATYVGKQFADDQNTINEDITGRVGEIPGYVLLDAGAKYRHDASGLTASVTVKNLADDVHVEARRPEGIQVGGFRQVNFGLRWDLQ